MTLVFLPIRMDMRSNTFAGSAMRREYFTGLPGTLVCAGEDVVPAFGVGRELDLHVVGVVVDDFVDVPRVAAQRAAHQDQRLAGPAAGGGRRRVVAERVMPEQFVGPVLAVVGEHAV